MNHDSQFAARLRSEMGRRRLRLVDLAGELGVSVNTISNWRRGHAEPPFYRLIELADQLDVTTDWLLGLEP